MNIHQKRQAVIEMYPKSPTWRQRVLNMPDDQVTAIYLRRAEKPVIKEPKQSKQDKPVQDTLF